MENIWTPAVFLFFIFFILLCAKLVLFTCVCFSSEHAGAAGGAAQWRAKREGAQLHLPADPSHPLVPQARHSSSRWNVPFTFHFSSTSPLPLCLFGKRISNSLNAEKCNSALKVLARRGIDKAMRISEDKMQIFLYTPSATRICG